MAIEIGGVLEGTTSPVHVRRGCASAPSIHDLSFMFRMRRGRACALSPFLVSVDAGVCVPPPDEDVAATIKFYSHVAFNEGMPAMFSSRSHATVYLYLGTQVIWSSNPVYDLATRA